MKQSFEPILSDLGPAIAWLTGRGVSPSGLAALLDATPGHIRVLAHRGRHAKGDQASIEHIFYADSSALGKLLPVRPRDEVIITRRKAAKMDWLENEIATRALPCRRQHRFLDGVARLRELSPHVGRPGNIRLIGLLAELHKQTAWFLLHSGLCSLALREVKDALRASRFAYVESGPCRHSKAYGQQFVEAALMASQAMLLSHRPETAWRILKRAEDAAESFGIEAPSDLYRQRGVCLFQQNLDADAGKIFNRARSLMQETPDGQNEALLLLTESRYVSLFHPPDWELAQKVLDAADRSFPQWSGDRFIAVLWAAACGLATDSPAANIRAVELLEMNREISKHSGHHATTSSLLALTPVLQLPVPLRGAWLRWVLFENAFQRRLAVSVRPYQIDRNKYTIGGRPLARSNPKEI